MKVGAACSQVVGMCFIRQDEGGKDVSRIAKDFQEKSLVSGINDLLKRWLVRMQKLPPDFISFHYEHFSAQVNIHRKCANVTVIYQIKMF